MIRIIGALVKLPHFGNFYPYLCKQILRVYPGRRRDSPALLKENKTHDIWQRTISTAMSG